MSAYSRCVQYSGDQFDTEQKNCIKDILMTDSYLWAASYIQSVQQSCWNKIGSNSSNWNDTNPSNSSVPASLDPIVNQLCPNDCSSKGTCNQGIEILM